ncbi:hypothetical protein BZA77DRAFT_309989 [Pyronema omphalodes]|nr:hypothetical protein BZA77DRAFT_309989 [Pyronema omphalodes]
MLPVFQIRDFRDAEENDIDIQLGCPKQYDDLVTEHPVATLAYVDEDADIITVKTSSELYDRIYELQDMRPIVFELLSSLRSSPNTAEGIRVWREYITKLDEKRSGKAVERSDTPSSNETPKTPQVSEAATNTADPAATDGAPTLYGGFINELERLLTKYSEEFDDPPEPSLEDVDVNPPHTAHQSIVKTALKSIISAAESVASLKEDLPKRAQPAVNNLNTAINTAMDALTTQIVHLSQAAQSAADMAERAANTTRDINTSELEAVKDKFVNLATGVGHVAAQVAQQVGRDVHNNVIENLDSVKKQVWEELERTKEEFKTTRETFFDALSGTSSPATPSVTTAAEDTATKSTKTEDTIVDTPVETVVRKKSVGYRPPTVEDDEEEAIYIAPARIPRPDPALATQKSRRGSASSTESEDSLYTTPKPSTSELLSKKSSVEPIVNTTEKEAVVTEDKPEVAKDAPTTDLRSGLSFFDWPAPDGQTADWVNNLHQNNPGKPPSVSSTVVSTDAERSETFWTQMAKISDVERAHGIPPPLPPKPESLAKSTECATYSGRTLPGPSHRASMHDIRSQNSHPGDGNPWSQPAASRTLPPTLPLGYPTPRHTSVAANQYARPRDLRRPHSMIGLASRPPPPTHSPYPPFCSDEEDKANKSASPSNSAPSGNKNHTMPGCIAPSLLSKNPQETKKEYGIDVHQVDMDVEKRRFEKEKYKRYAESMNPEHEEAGKRANDALGTLSKRIREMNVPSAGQGFGRPVIPENGKGAEKDAREREKEARERAEKMRRDAQRREQEARERARKLEEEAKRREKEARERAQKLEQEAKKREEEARDRAMFLEQQAKVRAQKLEQEAQRREQEARERAQKSEQERQQRMSQGNWISQQQQWMFPGTYENPQETQNQNQNHHQNRTGHFSPSIPSPLSFLSDLLSPPRVPSQHSPGFNNSHQGSYYDDDHAFANQMAQAMFESTANQQPSDSLMDAISLCIVHLVDMGYAETHGMDAIHFHANVAGGNLEKAIEQIEGNEE